MMEPDDPFADALGRLPLPRPSAARMHYAAGLAAGRRRARAWQATTAAALAALAVVSTLRPSPGRRPADVAVVVARPIDPGLPPPASADPTSLLRLCDGAIADATFARRAGGRGDRRGPVFAVWMTELPGTVD